jgi:DNA-binding transcriptional LysR family regulator
MDLRQIMYFMCVYEECSFTKAARKLGLVQPALSAQILRLEEEFRTQLFERTPRGLIPTASGKSFYELCTPIRRSIGSAKQQMLEMAQPNRISGTVRCGFPPTFFKSLIAPVVTNFVESYPGIDLAVKESYGGTLKEWVARGELDFALGAWFDDQSLEHSVIYEEDVALVCGAPIAGERLTPCDLGNIDNLKLILPSANHVLGPVLRQHISAGLLRPIRTMVVDSYVGVIEIARASNWAVLIPVTGLFDELSNPDFWIYPIARPQLYFRWHVIHEQARPLSSAAQLFVDAVVSEFVAKHALWKQLCEGNRANCEGIRAKDVRKGRKHQDSHKSRHR